jgi:hypothetical protein
VIPVSEFPTPRLSVIPGKINEWEITLLDEVFE